MEETKTLKAAPTGRRKRIASAKLSEKFIEEAFLHKDVLKEDFSSKIKIKSSIAIDTSISYTPMIDWGNYDISNLVQKLALFSKTLTGMGLHSYQLELQKRIFESVLRNDGEEITALLARQSGKTECIACTIVTLMVLLPVLAEAFPKQLSIYKKGIHIGLFAPIGEQAYTTHSRMNARLSEEMANEILADTSIDATKKYSNGILQIYGPIIKNINGTDIHKYTSYCRVQSAAKQAKIESKTYHLVIIEEAQDVDSMKVQKSIRPMLASTNGTLIQIGTPMPVISDFYNAIVRNRRTQYSRRIRNHFEYSYKTVQKYNPRYKAFVAKEKDRIGKESDAFRMAYNLEWLLEKGMALSPIQFDEYLKTSSGKFEYSHDGISNYAGGLDLAKKGDSTVLTIAKLELLPVDELGRLPAIKHVVNWLEMSGDNWEVIFETVLDFVNIYKLQTLAVDSTGVGDPIIDRLDAALRDTDCVILPVLYTQKQKHEMATLFYEELRKFLIRIPCHQSVRKTRRFKNFVEQWYACEKTYKGQYMQLEHTDIKGAKDDYVDSLLLLLYGVRNNTTSLVSTYRNPFFGDSPGVALNSERAKRYHQAIKQMKRRNVAKFRKALRV